MLETYAEILRRAGLDTRRAIVGAILAAKYRETALVSHYVREFVADLMAWNESRVEQFLTRHDTRHTIL